MIQKIISIKNIGRFKNYAASGDVTFRRYTLIFAENGRGKTTFCAILRSLSRNAPALILGRKTLGSPDSPEVQLLLSNGSATFRNGAWNAAYPDIAIFDGTYVTDNVFAGEVVDTEHRRNLYRVIIGTQGVTLAGRVNALDNEIRNKNNEIRDLRGQIQRHLAPGMAVDAFLGLQQDDGIDERIAAKEQELHVMRQAGQLQQRSGLSPLAVPVFPAAFAEILARTLENVGADAGRRVAEHLARHRMQPRGEEWLTEGLGDIAHDACPFCAHALAGASIIASYRGFFRREDHALRAEVSKLGSQEDPPIRV